MSQSHLSAHAHTCSSSFLQHVVLEKVHRVQRQAKNIDARHKSITEY